MQKFICNDNAKSKRISALQVISTIVEASNALSGVVSASNFAANNGDPTNKDGVLCTIAYSTDVVNDKLEKLIDELKMAFGFVFPLASPKNKELDFELIQA